MDAKQDSLAALPAKISLSEDLLTFSAAAKTLPPRRGNRPTHTSCLFRWYRNGLRGVRLEAIRVGGTLMTSKQALERFFERLSEARGPSRPAPPHIDKTYRQRQIEAASRQVEEALR